MKEVRKIYCGITVRETCKLKNVLNSIFITRELPSNETVV